MKSAAEEWKDQGPHRLMYGCPRFDACSAAFCPLGAPDGNGAGLHKPGDAVCIFLREYGKTGGPERIAARLCPEQLAVFNTSVEKILVAGGDIARRLKRAAKHLSRLESGRRLRRRYGAPSRRPRGSNLRRAA